MVSLTLNDPLLGYANQYDMARTSACLDVWPTGVDEPDEATPEAPRPEYAKRHLPTVRCHFGSEVIFSGASLWIADAVTDMGIYDLRIVGFGKVLILLVAIVLFDRRLRSHPGARVVHAAAALLILSDPLNTLYLNTLYTEFSALFGAYVATMGICLMRLNDRASATSLAIFGLGLLTLLFSKHQHLLLPWLLWLFACAGLRQRVSTRGLLAITLVLSAATLAQFALMQQRDKSFAMANGYNTTFLTVLPSIEADGGRVEDFGLNEQCRTLVNTSWYRMRGHDPHQTCPAAFDLSRAQLLIGLLREPSALVDVALRSVYQSSAWRVGYLGEVAGQDYGKIDDTAWPTRASVSSLISLMTYPVYVFFLLGPFLYAFIVAISSLRRVAHREFSRSMPITTFMLLLCTSSALLTWLIALIGDGYSDLAKHLHLAFNFVLLAWLMVIADWIVRVRAGWTRSDAWLAGIVLVLGGSGLWLLTRWPVAIGTMDAPDPEVRTDQTLQLTGWVKDPFGITGVHAELGEHVFTGQITSMAPDVDTMFPVSSTFPGRRFSMQVIAPSHPGPFKVELTLRNGIDRVTTFDSVWLTAAPATGQ